MKSIVIRVSVFVLLFTALTLVHAQVTGRWKPLPELDQYVDQLNKLDVSIPDWISTEAPLEDADSLGTAGIRGFSSKTYRYRPTGASFTTLIVCGRPGPISVHTPDVCYRSSGFTPTTEPSLVTIGEPGTRTLTLWNLQVAPPASRAGAADLVIYWTWIGQKGINSPSNARLAFSGMPALYKLYFVREAARNQSDEITKKDQKRDTAFITDFVFQVEKSLDYK
jgi:hypothetical protein